MPHGVEKIYRGSMNASIKCNAGCLSELHTEFVGGMNKSARYLSDMTLAPAEIAGLRRNRTVFPSRRGREAGFWQRECAPPSALRTVEISQKVY